MFERAPGQPGPFWEYRRLIDHGQFAPGQYDADLSLINWPAADYRGGDLLSGSLGDRLAHLEAARNLSLGFLHWLQTAIRHDRGETGYPGLELRRDFLGTEDGLAKYPYIREARRLRTLTTLREQDVAAGLHEGKVRGRFFPRSIGVGLYDLDIHPGACEELVPPRATLPFQLPLGMLVATELVNLIPAGKAAGTTHITNSCTRLHPVEWAIGEAAGSLAAHCLETGLTPRDLHADSLRTRALQEKLVARGAPIYWHPTVSPTDSLFVEAQLAPFASDSARTLIEGQLRYPPLPR